ncbi:2-succinyl-6-hydroxy-2,4-cyclohexadiene-1-carboxylate synthase [Ornithinibacillus californiensis]|uniref:2-succinyl-6-hydroxy-2, 4-cyclohexadiene-1-carboxylate synthase n=1 Tax=Ornithinibacillus californiensis TaxID=161536 RepID=UPI00064DB3B5|nr:2-succinyl-6-hydroxy-2,4-cyclohexadiene-1-carboxylate synthase [Ornithinibacillus californiensis]
MRKVIRDCQYWYEVYGNGEAVVLLHGFTGSTKTWKYFVEKYQSEFKIIVIDLPGHGRTITPSPISMEQCCYDLHAILTDAGVNSFHLVGYSMGGRTALTYAMYFQEQLKSLILESSSPGLATEEERIGRMANDENLAIKLEANGVKAFIDFWEKIPLFETQKSLPEDVVAEVRNERLSQTKEGLALSLRGMGTGSQPNWWGKLSSVTKPVLLLVGEKDNKFIQLNKKMHESLSNSKLKVVENAGHAIHVERPAFFGKIVEEFILANRKV